MLSGDITANRRLRADTLYVLSGFVKVLDGAGYEDPCPFWDDDGKAYLVHSKVGAGPVILHAMSPDGKTLHDAGTTIIEDKANLPILEGPKTYKRHGYYFIFAPIGGVETGPRVGVVEARQCLPRIVVQVQP